MIMGLMGGESCREGITGVGILAGGSWKVGKGKYV